MMIDNFQSYTTSIFSHLFHDSRWKESLSASKIEYLRLRLGDNLMIQQLKDCALVQWKVRWDREKSLSLSVNEITGR